MISAFLDCSEDPRRPLIAPNYWILKRVGLLLPKNSLAKALYIILHEIVTFFVFTQFMELYVIRSDLDLVLTNMKTSMLSVVCIVKVNTFVFYQTKWRQVLEYVTEADKMERMNPDCDRKEILEKYTKYCRKLTYFYWGLIFATYLTTVFQPLMIYLSSSTFRENYHNGTEPFPHILSSWMPIDKNESPGYYITIVWHTLLCAYGVAIMAAYDTSIVVIMVFFGGKLDLLRDRCKKMVSFAGVTVSDETAAKTVRELHQIHTMLTKYSRMFNSVLSPVMFFYMVMCSLNLCASAFQLTNENMTMGTYESDWWKSSLKQSKDVLILSGQLRISNTFSAGPFANLTLATFIKILKGAYSYYTLLSKRG